MTLSGWLSFRHRSKIYVVESSDRRFHDHCPAPVIGPQWMMRTAQRWLTSLLEAQRLVTTMRKAQRSLVARPMVMLTALLILFVLSSVPTGACDEHDKDVTENSKLDLSSDAAPGTGSVIDLNNDGVRALNMSDFRTAIFKFESALRLDPNYRLGRLNLGIAYNNYGLSLRDKPKEALVYFEKAAYLDPGNTITESNVRAVITMLGSDPNSVEDRERIGDQRVREGHLDCAIVEYKAAMNAGGGSQQGLKSTFDRISNKLAHSEKMLREPEPRYEHISYVNRLLRCDYDLLVTLSMFALYLLDLCIVVECMRRVSSQKRSWWIFGLIIGAISVSAGFLLGQANAFRHVLGLLILGLPPARALYAVTKKKFGNWFYTGVVFVAAAPCTIFFFGWLGCVVMGSWCSGGYTRNP